jgi:hypothetical protein
MVAAAATATTTTERAALLPPEVGTVGFGGVALLIGAPVFVALETGLPVVGAAVGTVPMPLPAGALVTGAVAVGAGAVTVGAGAVAFCDSDKTALIM